MRQSADKTREHIVELLVRCVRSLTFILYYGRETKYACTLCFGLTLHGCPRRAVSVTLLVPTFCILTSRLPAFPYTAAACHPPTGDVPNAEVLRGSEKCRQVPSSNSWHAGISTSAPRGAFSPPPSQAQACSAKPRPTCTGPEEKNRLSPESCWLGASR